MANNEKLKMTPEEVDYAVYKNMLADQEYSEFIDLISNALTITDLPENVPKKFVIESLINAGRIGIYQVGDEELWLPAKVGGVLSEMGIPKEWVLTTANGKAFYLKDKSVKIIRLRPCGESLQTWLWNESQNLAYIKMCKLCNLIATQTADVYECENDKTVIEMKSIFKKRAIGMPAIFSRKAGIASATQNIGSKTPFLADKLNQLFDEDKNRVLERLGILTANSDKRERVQVGEITASLGEVIDSIYVFIDTFNADAEKNGIPQRMKLNSTVESLYANYNQGDDENDNQSIDSMD